MSGVVQIFFACSVPNGFNFHRIKNSRISSLVHSENYHGIERHIRYYSNLLFILFTIFKIKFMTRIVRSYFVSNYFNFAKFPFFL